MDIMASPDGKYLFAVCASGRRILVIDINKRDEVRL